MSVQYTTRVWDQSKQKGTNRLMLLAIADSATKDLGISWPGLDTLAKMMGPKYSRRAAGQRIEALAKTGELAVFPRKGRSHDYIVIVGMTYSEIRKAYKSLAARRKVSPAKLADLRRSFAGGAVRESSLVPVGESSQGVRRNTVTIRNEPSGEPVVAGTAAAATLVKEVKPSPDKSSLYAIWESEAKMVLSPMLGEEIGDLLDTFGLETVRDAIREAIKATGPGKFGIKYVWKICERWKREGRGERPIPVIDPYLQKRKV